MANKKKASPKSAAKRKSASELRSTSPKSFKLSEEMKQWCALLTQELATWGQVKARKMFGMTSFYRRAAIFAAVPASKAYFSPNTIIFKLQIPTHRQQHLLANDPWVKLEFGIGQKWYGYELGSVTDINGALEWLDEAFKAAKAPTQQVRKRTA